MNASPPPRYRLEWQIDERRDWIFENLPHNGYVFQDLDGIAYVFSPPPQRFMMLEFKWNQVNLSVSQQHLFSFIHSILRKGDPATSSYVGFYLVQWMSFPLERGKRAKIDFSKNPKVNHQELTWEQFRDWLAFKRTLPSLFDEAKSCNRIGKKP